MPSAATLAARRTVLIRWNKKPENHFALLHFAFGIIAWRHALPG